DGDLSAGITAAVVGSGVHAVMGTGGAPEGVLTAAAMRCLNGEIFARLVVSKPGDEERCRAMGITDLNKVYRSKDLAPGDSIIFAATGVTDGTLMRGVRFFGDGTRTSSVIMQNKPHRIRFIDSIHVPKEANVKIRFCPRRAGPPAPPRGRLPCAPSNRLSAPRSCRGSPPRPRRRDERHRRRRAAARRLASE